MKGSAAEILVRYDVPIDPSELPPVKPRMMALERSVGLPSATKSVSWAGIKAIAGMIKER